MTDQPPFGGFPPPPWSGYPSVPGGPGSYPPPPYGDYPPPAGGYPPPGGYGYPVGYPQQPPSGLVTLPGLGTVTVASFGQRILARLIDGVIYGVVYVIFMVVAIILAASTSHTVVDQYGHQTSAPSGVGMAGFFLAFAVAMGSGLLYEWLMLATRARRSARWHSASRWSTSTPAKSPATGRRSCAR